jgi:glycosyltransferase involved in cell wall biosynthesis
MRVLHIIDSGGLYGAETMLLNLVAEQVKLGLDPVIASIGEKGIDEKPIEVEAKSLGFSVKEFRMVPGPNLLGAFEVLRYAQRSGFDVLHSHGYKGNIMFGFIPKGVRKVPMITTLHGWTSTNGYSKMWVYEWLDAHSLKFIDAVVLVNRGMLSNLRLKNLHGVNFHVVNNGIPISISSSGFSRGNLISQPYNNLDKTIIKFCQGGYTIGSIGRLSSEKGFLYLIDAVKQAKKFFGDLRLVIIGEGEDRKPIEEKIVECNLKKDVLLPGYKKDARRYLKLFDAYVISSLTEGLPISLLEAMEAKIPVIATRVGGIPDVLDDGEAGLLVKPFDSRELFDALVFLRKNPESAEKRVSYASKTVSKNYSSHAMAERYREVYRFVLDRWCA